MRVAIVEMRHVDPETDMNTTVEEHRVALHQAGEMVQKIVDAGLPPDHWIEVTIA